MTNGVAIATHHRPAIIIRTLLLVSAVMFAPALLAAQVPIPNQCPDFEAWQVQAGPRSDPTGYYNVAYPEANATYWGTGLTQPIGASVLVHGQYPLSRYMSFQLYDGENVVDSINDISINPDPGQNNPYRTGVAQGDYTVRIVFGRAPRRRPANTIYTGDLTTVALLYRIYYPNDPDNLAAGSALPTVFVDGKALSSCPIRPVITPENQTVWGRLDDTEYTGIPPATSAGAFLSPQWKLSNTNPLTPFFPSQDNSYMSTALNRDFLKPPYNFEVVVVRMKAPTFTDTQHGVPPYAPADMRFWSFCTNEPITSGVVRCVPDNAAIDVNGFVTFVISDPSKKPPAETLAQWGAAWLPWGAIAAGDIVYDIRKTELTNADGVFYYDLVIYRQTMANPSFIQSIQNVSALPPNEWKAAMGDYWPAIGYCTRATFQVLGAGCINNRRGN